jgi:hypothetical protein
MLSEKILNIEPVRNCWGKQQRRCEYDRKKVAKIQCVLIGDKDKANPKTLELLKKISGYEIIFIPKLSKLWKNIKKENVWVFLIYDNEIFSDNLDIALKHYVNTPFYDSWEIPVNMTRNAFDNQIRLFRGNIKYSNGFLRNAGCTGKALIGSVKRWR